MILRYRKLILSRIVRKQEFSDAQIRIPVFTTRLIKSKFVYKVWKEIISLCWMFSTRQYKILFGREMIVTLFKVKSHSSSKLRNLKRLWNGQKFWNRFDFSHYLVLIYRIPCQIIYLIIFFFKNIWKNNGHCATFKLQVLHENQSWQTFCWNKMCVLENRNKTWCHRNWCLATSTNLINCFFFKQ